LTGPLYDWGYFRTLIFVGCFLEVFEMMILSLCKTYWEVMLAQALVVGVGCGCIFIPSVAILPSYFSTKKGLANGIAASGSGLGKIHFAINSFIGHELIPKIRRSHLSNRISSSRASHWLRLGNSNHCLYDACYINCTPSCHEDALEAACGSQNISSIRMERTSLCFVDSCFIYRDHGIVST
jgi:hypothetical protein